jgi:hypothetical protein
MSLEVKRDHDVITLAASGARTVTGAADAVRLPRAPNGLAFTLDITVDEQTSSDKLDVYVQTKLDGVNWLDVVHFTQNNGDDGAKRYVHKIEVATAVSEFEVGAALTETNGRDLFGDEWRVRWTVVDNSGNASFTCSVTAIPF